MITVHWFDGEKDVGSEITAELPAPYGQDGWEVVATMQNNIEQYRTNAQDHPEAALLGRIVYWME